MPIRIALQAVRGGGVRLVLDPLKVARVALALAPPCYLADIQERHLATGLARAVEEHDTASIFEWIVPLLALQGVSDRAAFTFAKGRRTVRWNELTRDFAASPCPRLRSWWAFADCGYRKGPRTCSELQHQAGCPVPGMDLRKGTLSIAAAGLALFFRDVCGGDLVGWIDSRLAGADPGPDAVGRGRLMRDAVLEPLCEVPGAGAKVMSLVLAELLLGAGGDRERWAAAGASFAVIDTLVHAVLHRSGLIDHFGQPHAYGPACWALGGCAAAIEHIAELIDARAYGRDNPQVFPRLVARALWGLGAASEWGICNGNRIDDAVGCRQRWCPASSHCPCLPLR